MYFSPGRKLEEGAGRIPGRRRQPPDPCPPPPSSKPAFPLNTSFYDLVVRLYLLLLSLSYFSSFRNMAIDALRRRRHAPHSRGGQNNTVTVERSVILAQPRFGLLYVTQASFVATHISVVRGTCMRGDDGEGGSGGGARQLPMGWATQTKRRTLLIPRSTAPRPSCVQFSYTILLVTRSYT